MVTAAHGCAGGHGSQRPPHGRRSHSSRALTESSPHTHSPGRLRHTRHGRSPGETLHTSARAPRTSRPQGPAPTLRTPAGPRPDHAARRAHGPAHVPREYTAPGSPVRSHRLSHPRVSRPRLFFWKLCSPFPSPRGPEVLAVFLASLVSAPFSLPPSAARGGRAPLEQARSPRGGTQAAPFPPSFHRGFPAAAGAADFPAGYVGRGEESRRELPSSLRR